MRTFSRMSTHTLDSGKVSGVRQRHGVTDPQRWTRAYGAPGVHLSGLRPGTWYRVVEAPAGRGRPHADDVWLEGRWAGSVVRPTESAGGPRRDRTRLGP